MTSFLKAAAVAAIITGFAAPALAMDLTPLSERPYITTLFDTAAAPLPTKARITLAPRLSSDARIGVVRVDRGRMITLPFNEAESWERLDSALPQRLIPVTAGAYLNAVPNIPMDGQDTDNKIDEIRLAAVDSGLDYVLIYGIFNDAYFASFGGKHLRETGLSVAFGSPAWQGGDAKALLVDSYTGEVIDAAVTWRPDMGALTDAVADIISTHSPRETA